MKERIQKILANAGVASRRNVEELIRQGRVAVNGRVTTDLPILIDPERDKVKVDDEPIRLREPETNRRFYFLMNKPKGVFTTNSAQGEQTRAIDLLPTDLPARLYPVGRLDAESKGLLLLTNDGDLTNQLTHPRYGVPKTYRAVIDGYIKPETIEALERGVWMSDRSRGTGVKAPPSRIRIINRTRIQSVLEITVREGRNRQVRPMLAGMGHKVRELTRIKIGPLTLNKLAPGQVRPLTQNEVKTLKQVARRKDRQELHREDRKTSRSEDVKAF